MALDPIPPPLARLYCARTLVHVKEYARVVRVLAPNTFTTPLVETITAFCHLHPLVEVDLPPFVNDFHLEMDFVLNKHAFIFVLMRSPCFSSNNPSSMVYELL